MLPVLRFLLGIIDAFFYCFFILPFQTFCQLIRAEWMLNFDRSTSKPFYSMTSWPQELGGTPKGFAPKTEK